MVEKNGGLAEQLEAKDAQYALNEQKSLLTGNFLERTGGSASG